MYYILQGNEKKEDPKRDKKADKKVAQNLLQNEKKEDSKSVVPTKRDKKADRKVAQELVNTGIKFLEQGKFAQAEKKFNDSLEIYANYPAALYNLAVMKIEL